MKTKELRAREPTEKENKALARLKKKNKGVRRKLAEAERSGTEIHHLKLSGNPSPKKIWLLLPTAES
jgi:hypothetical protein